MSISRGNVPFLGRFPRLIDTFLLTAEDFLLTKLQVGIPVEYEKQLEQLLQLVTTLSISHAQNRARSGYAMARKGAMKWNLHASRVTILLHGKQQNTTLSISHAQNRARSSFAMTRKGTMKWNASPWTFLPIVLAKRCS